MNTQLVLNELQEIKSSALALAGRCDRAIKGLKAEQNMKVEINPMQVRLEKRAYKKFLKTK